MDIKDMDIKDISMDIKYLPVDIKKILEYLLLCKRCGKPTDLKPVTLLDTTLVRLCMDCLNDYYYFILDHPSINDEVLKIDVLRLYLERKRKLVSLKECKNYYARLNDLRITSRPFIKEFLEGKK